jgi:hypothetical protein
MFERFTDRARRVVVLAQEEARLLDHAYIGTEHLLLGLLAEGTGFAARALDGLGIELGAVRADVAEIIGRGESIPSGHIPFTPRAKRVLELSLREALGLGHNYIGTEHVLLGLIAEGEGVAAQVLVQRGARLDQVRVAVLVELGKDPGRPSRRGAPDDTAVDVAAAIARLTAISAGSTVTDMELRFQGDTAQLVVKDPTTVEALRDLSNRIRRAEPGDNIAIAAVRLWADVAAALQTFVDQNPGDPPAE